jgi:dTDP-4-amino-4,6-dideoxygalactose transaminase
VQAAVLRVKLRRLEEWTRRRRAIADEYRERLSGAERAGRLVLPREIQGRVHAYHQFIVRTPRRDEVRRRMAEAGIGTEVYYPVPLHLQACFTALGGRPGDLPESERAAAEVLALPIWPEMAPDEVAAVASALERAVA